MSQVLCINVLVDWRLSGILTSKLACGLVASDFINDEFLGHYPIRYFKNLGAAINLRVGATDHSIITAI